MTIRLDTVIGLDVGTTTSKALIRVLDRSDTVVVEAPTPWQLGVDGGTEIYPGALRRAAVDLIGRATSEGTSRWGSLGVRAISVTGLAESGVILDGSGRAEIPSIAWFDSRGEQEFSALAQQLPDLAATFPGVTGLPWSAQASLAKLLWLDGQRRLAPGSVWLSVPEWIVSALGGDRVREPSLASRTGLVRQDTGELWAEAAEVAGVSGRFLPDQASAGMPVGRLTSDELPAASGAVLSVAGHDHPVAALAVDATGPDEVFNSSGTADVMARAVPSTLTDAHRAAIVAAGWSAGRHIVPETDLLLAGGSGGLVLRRVLDALGATLPDARARLDATSAQVTALPPGLIISADGRARDDVEIRFRDGVTPAVIWSAATRYTAELARAMLADVEPIVGRHRRAVAAGGWIGMSSVRSAKTAAIESLEFSDVRQPGATGAAMLAEYSLTAHSMSLPEFLTDASQFADA